MLLAEELLLLALDDRTGKNRLRSIDLGLAGAVLVELALLERVRVAERGESVKAGRLVVTPGPAPESPVLARGLAVLSEREGRKPESVLHALGKGLRESLTDKLLEARVLRREWHRVLGLIPTQRLLPQDGAPEAEVRERVRAALAGAEPDARTAAVIALLSALKAVTTVFDVPDERAVRKRAKEIAEGQWAATAVRKAIEAINAATMAAATAATVGDGGSSGS
jgi:Golgi phosphoprotein 3 (GPP34)